MFDANLDLLFKGQIADDTEMIKSIEFTGETAFFVGTGKAVRKYLVQTADAPATSFETANSVD